MRTSAKRRRKCAVYRSGTGPRLVGARKGSGPVATVANTKRRASAGQDALLRPRRTSDVGSAGTSGPAERPVRIPGRAHAAARVEHHRCAARSPVKATTRAGLRPVDATSSALGVGTPSYRNGPSARPRLARWITARDDCHVRPPFRTGACVEVPAHPAPSPDGELMNLSARYASPRSVSSLSLQLFFTGFFCVFR